MYYLFFIFIFQGFGPVDELRSGTRRLFPTPPVPTTCSGTVPTTEHYTLGDWSTSSPI